MSRIGPWLAVVLLAAVTLLAWQRYQRDVASIALAAVPAGQEVRVLGRVQAGSLVRSEQGATFVLEDGLATMAVSYHGPDADTLRDLKTVLVKGCRGAEGMVATAVSIEPNYGYIAAAYGLVIGLLAAFFWMLGRTVHRLEKRLDEA